MNLYLSVAIALSAGIALGGVYYGGLLATAAVLPRVRHPALLFAVSMAVRLALAVTVFFLLTRGGRWERLVLSLFGFLLVRIVYIRHHTARTRPPHDTE
jgi:F1F0 ATPase subunit 2